MPKFERQGVRSEAYTKMYPPVTGGVCEYCGIINNLLPSTEQYKLCPHFKGMGELRCSYCPETADTTEVVRMRKIIVHEHPDKPDELVVVCDSLNCSDAHLKRFKRSA